MAKRSAYTAGLRALADILDAHPELPLPYEGSSPDLSQRMTFHFLSGDDPRGKMIAARRALGVPVDKNALDAYFNLHGQLHGLYFAITTFRNEVCERVVVGTREVEIEEPDPEVLAALPKVTRTVVVEDVEWECRPVLANEEPSTAAGAR